MERKKIRNVRVLKGNHAQGYVDELKVPPDSFDIEILVSFTQRSHRDYSLSASHPIV